MSLLQIVVVTFSLVMVQDNLLQMLVVEQLTRLRETKRTQLSLRLILHNLRQHLLKVPLMQLSLKPIRVQQVQTVLVLSILQTITHTPMQLPQMHN